jgi:peroxin-5
MSFLSNLLQGQGCSVDGEITNSNGLSSLMDGIYDNFNVPMQGMDSASAMDQTFDVSLNGYNRQDIDHTYNNNDMASMSSAASMDKTYMDGGANNVFMNGGPQMFSSNPLELMMHMQRQQNDMLMFMNTMNTMNNFNQALQPSTQQLHHPVNTINEAISLAVESGSMNPEKLQEIWNNYGHTSNSTEFNEFKSKLNEKLDGPSQSGYDEAWNRLKSKLESIDDFKYEYVRDNPYKEMPENTNFFAIGLQLYNEGNIKSAIEAFEAEINVNNENDEAWRLLGECHAENENDKTAIYCLNKAHEYDPYNLDALLALGTSYTNELNAVKALQSLKMWLTHNPKFVGIQIKEDEYSDGTLMDEVMQMMLQAESYTPNDPDILTVIGVLYNVSQDYDSAVLCFEKALSLKPNNYSLLNKIAATLANGNKFSQALKLYDQALQMRPQYTRAWLNLGVSYSNLNNHLDAAKAYAQAIRLNRHNPQMYNYLQVELTNLNRLDLVPLCNMENMEQVSTEIDKMHLF